MACIMNSKLTSL